MDKQRAAKMGVFFYFVVFTGPLCTVLTGTNPLYFKEVKL